jgi:predicted ATPase/DNA-binding SARP family transcriptional activator
MPLGLLDVRARIGDTTIVLSLSLLGPLQIARDGKPLAVRLTAKAQALLAYLAVEADMPHPRDFLAGLLWPDHPQAAARNSLRQALHQLRRALGKAAPPFLLVTRQAVQFNSASDHSLDVAEFSALIRECDGHVHRRRETCGVCVERLQRAVTLYRGDLLTGFFLKDSAAFEEWALVTREQLARQALAALHSLAEYHALRRDYQRMEYVARRQIEIDPFQEGAHRQVMRALAWSGQRNAALAHYGALCQMLAQDLDTPPDAETATMRAQIESDSLQPPTPPPLHNWPTYLTPFFGRERELAQISKYLQAADVYLLTIIGPGGIGKTRLVLRAAEQEAFAFRDGACFVPLDDVSVPELAISAIASALHVSFSESADPKHQLLNYLRNKDLLLVLDGLEHLVEESDLVSDLLSACPTLKVLAASREGLNLKQEWRLYLQGLSSPDSGALADLETCSAVQLFLQRARQVRPEFALSESDRSAVACICELVDGMPLALELAAGWVKVLSCAQIAHEIERGADFLVTSMRDVPDRHRSVRAVFEHSWRLLSEEEQSALRQLAVFCSGFCLDAAEAVVSLLGTPGSGQLPVESEASSSTLLHPLRTLLSSLVDKSLLQVMPSGRYEQHSLVRQYAEERLTESPGEDEQSRERHGRYYVSRVLQWGQQLKSAQQAQALAEMGQEMGNVRAAWRWAVSGRRWAEIGRCLTGLIIFYRSHSWWLEGEAVLGQAVATLSEAGPDAIAGDPVKAIVLGTALVDQGVCCVQLSRLEQAEGLLKKSLPLLDPAATGSVVLAMALGWLGTAEIAQGKHELGGEHLQQGLVVAQESGDRWCIAMLRLLSGHYARMRDLAEAAEHYRASLSIFRDLGDRRLMATPHFYLGEMMRLSGDLAGAEPHLEESLAFAREVGAPQLTGWSLAALGSVACGLGDYSEAQRRFQESLALAGEIGDVWTVIANCLGLGAVASALHDDAAAKEHLIEALRMAAEARAWRHLVRGLIGWAGLLAGQGQAEQECAVGLLGQVLSHPQSLQEHRIQAERLLDELRTILPPDVFDEALERGRVGTLESTVKEILGIQWLP